MKDADEDMAAQPLPGRCVFLALVQQRLQDCAAGAARAAMLVVELDAHYAGRAAARIPAVVGAWGKRAGQSPSCCRLDEKRYGIFIAPSGDRARARRLAEQLAHALDPRVCPSLRRALPYAWVGASAFPDDAPDAAALLAYAERDLEQRHQDLRPRRDLQSRLRRRTGPSCLQPLAAR
jgi:hypothetical protein